MLAVLQPPFLYELWMLYCTFNGRFLIAKKRENGQQLGKRGSVHSTRYETGHVNNDGAKMMMGSLNMHFPDRS